MPLTYYLLAPTDNHLSPSPKFKDYHNPTNHNEIVVATHHVLVFKVQGIPAQQQQVWLAIMKNDTEEKSNLYCYKIARYYSNQQIAHEMTDKEQN